MLNWGMPQEFEAKDSDEIILNLKKALNRENEDDKFFLLSFASIAKRSHNTTLNSQCNRSFVQSIENANILTKLSNPSETQKTVFLSKWTENGFGSLDFGKLTSSQLNSLSKLTLRFREIANDLNDHTISEVLNCNYEGPHYQNRYELLTDKKHLLSFFLLNFVMHTVEEETKLDRSARKLHDIIYINFPELLSQYEIMWKFALNLPMDINFIRSGLNYLADILNKHPLHKYDMISDYLPRCKVEPGAKLYFAYGSNMNHKQMKTRCPSAKFIGCESLKNFEYYIDCRGVASLKPKYGATVSGVIWNIQDSSDWERLDRYEGVTSGIYQRHAIEAEVFGHAETFQIYISNTLKIGKPRPGYQENINAAVLFLENLYKKEILEMNKVDNERSVELGLENYDYPFKLWQNEMTHWLGAKNV